MIHTATSSTMTWWTRATAARPADAQCAQWDASAILMGDTSTRGDHPAGGGGADQVLALLATTVHRMSVGELMQLEIRDHPHFDEASYLQVIYEKTPVSSNPPAARRHTGRAPAPSSTLWRLRPGAGIVLQIIDDILDYVASPEVLASLGSDLAEGKQTCLS